MLTSQQLEQIKEHLERAQNPLFLFDNDVDGLCSYIILKKHIGRGKGFPIKTFPAIAESTIRKVEEFNSDYVFVLDHSIISDEFLNELEMKNIPLVIIDHHKLEVDNLKDRAEVFNSYPSGEPTTYLCYNVFKDKSDRELTLVGCTADIFKPDFAKEYSKEKPLLYNSEIDTFDILFKTEIGKIARMINAGLRDSTTNVVKLMKHLEKINSIEELLYETKDTQNLHYKFNKINEYIKKTIKKAKLIQDKIIILEYSGESSISSEIANELLFKYRKKFILTAFRKPEAYNISVRGKNAKKILLKAIEDIENAAGGGHEEACGGRIPLDSWEEFRKKLISLV